MAEHTPNLGLLKKDPLADGNETFNIETMLNDNWDKIDEAVGQVREELENVDVDIPNASLTEKGIVQLSNATNGTREDVAATEKAVKAAYDEALAGKQLGVEQKANVVAALNSIGVAASTSETWAQLVAKMAGVIRATGNATPGDVLAGKTFSNASGNGLTGGMPNRSAENHHMPGLETTVWAGDRAFIRPPAGYYDGNTWVTAPATTLKSENIKQGINILGIDGTYGKLLGEQEPAYSVWETQMPDNTYLTSGSLLDTDYEGYIYVLSAPSKLLIKYSPLNGSQVWRVSIQWSQNLHDIKIDRNNNVWISDNSGNILKFDKNGRHLLTFYTAGNSSVKFDIDNNSNIYVVTQTRRVSDLNYGDIRKYNSNGQLLHTTTLQGISSGHTPQNIGVSPDGSKIVVYSSSGHIFTYGSTLNFINLYSDGKIHVANIIVENNGDCYCTAQDNINTGSTLRWFPFTNPNNDVASNMFAGGLILDRRTSRMFGITSLSGSYGAFGRLSYGKGSESVRNYYGLFGWKWLTPVWVSSQINCICLSVAPSKMDEGIYSLRYERQSNGSSQIFLRKTVEGDLIMY
ncbi:tail fiber protein [Paenibacillus sp. 7541]|uniref:tail fiber protein n=1 Tax=Paenibacillus sp. 7541 TaxID=2026236 RepID=UPI0020D02181|nr:tail fiber protein [Paenibacillus sp. 7541]